MLLLYNLGVQFYFILIWVASHFNKKANLWIKGRKNVIKAPGSILPRWANMNRASRY